MTTTLTTVDAILKEIYGPRIEDQLQSEVIAWKRIERTSEGVTKTAGGKYVDFPIRVQRNHGIGYRNENEQLPAARRQGYAEVHVTLNYGYGRVRLTGQVMELAETDAQSFASAMDREMNGLKDDVMKDQNRQAYGDGSGLLAVINDATTSATHAVLSTQYLEVGMLVDVKVRSTGADVSADLTIDAISGLNVTFSASFVAATTQGVYRQDSYGRELTGLGLIVDDTTDLHGVSPSTQPKWAATVSSNSGTARALSEGLMITQVDAVRVAGGGRTSLILATLGVRRAYFNLLTQQRRYVNTKDFAGGFTGLAFHHGKEIPVVEDPDCPTVSAASGGTMWGIDEDKLKIYRTKEWHWADDDGSVLKWVHDYDAWECVLRQYAEVGTSQRNAHWKIEDITEG